MQFSPREGQEFEWANLQKLNAQEVALGGGGGGGWRKGEVKVLN